MTDREGALQDALKTCLQLVELKYGNSDPEVLSFCNDTRELLGIATRIPPRRTISDRCNF